MEMRKGKEMPIGVDSFSEMRRRDLCYVDKTFFIQRLLDSGCHAMLFTRPRRFGKTLALDMVRRFLDCNNREQNRPLFDGLAIAKSARHMEEQGKYPVIFLDFKDAKEDTIEEIENGIRESILDALDPFDYLLSSDKVSNLKKERLRKVMTASASLTDLSHALRLLSAALAEHHGQPVVVLIDEYDTPLQSAYLNGFYQPICDIIRNLFSSALKSNENLRLGVITGVLRIAKDSLFSGLNNLKVDTIMSDKYADCSGFTQAEVEAMAENYGVPHKVEEIKAWYDGYRFGELDVYNPWSVVQYFDEGCKPQAYWVDTTSNDLTIEFLRRLEGTQRKKIEDLYLGGTIDERLDTSVVYRQLDDTDTSLVFSLMTMTGYLKPISYVGCGNYELKVPNAEINSIFANEIISYLERDGHVNSLYQLWKYLRQNNPDAFAAKLKEVMVQSSSYFNSQEAYYHGFMVCLSLGLDEQYRVLSEREAGLGRADILLQPRFNPALPGFVFELKQSDDSANLDQLAEAALQQIIQQRYAEEFPPQIHEVRCYGLAFCKKKCAVMSQSVMR